MSPVRRRSGGWKDQHVGFICWHGETYKIISALLLEKKKVIDKIIHRKLSKTKQTKKHKEEFIVVVSAADVCRFDAAEKGTKQKKTFLCGGTKRRRVLFTRRDHTDIPDVHAHQVTHTHTHTHTQQRVPPTLSPLRGEKEARHLIVCSLPPPLIHSPSLLALLLSHTHTHIHTLWPTELLAQF